MRTTDAGDMAGEIGAIRWVRTFFLVMAVTLVTNSLAGMVFGAYATLSDVAWGYFRSSGPLDCVFVGSSYAERGFDPVAYDEVMGTESASLATPGQVLPDSLDAIRVAIAEKGVDRIVLGIGIESFTGQDDPHSHVPYVCARYRHDPLRCASELARFAWTEGVRGKEESLNVMFPWTFTSIHSVIGIAGNLSARIGGAPFDVAAESVTPGWRYIGKGYGNYDSLLDMGNGDTTVSTYGAPSIDETCLSTLEDICRECEEAGVDLVVAVPPHPSYDLVAMGRAYPDAMTQVQGVVEAHGFAYIDLAMARSQTLSMGAEDYGDFEHLSPSGARKATVALAEYIGKRDGGGDPSLGFYSYGEWDRWVSERGEEQV